MKGKVLLLAHGKLSSAFIDTIKLIYGDTQGLMNIDMPEPMDQQAYYDQIRNAIVENLDTGVLILCDLLGGSPFLTCSRLLMEFRDQVEIVTGYNLPLLLEVMSSIENSTIQELKSKIMEKVPDSVVDVKERMFKK